MINSKPEILAPAGAWEQLYASVRAGADAVYLGSGSMNARQAADNFNGSRLDEAVAYCHECGVKVYLAMNTLLFDDEFDEAERLVKQVCSLPVDAIIVQDAGLAAMIRRCAPEMPLHASTQMTIHNPSALKTLEKMGFSRAILAREMTAKEIAEMSAASEMELEAFVHGALCMSVSGQCYMSAMLGSRSGNRGRCAQPCRLPFRTESFENCLSLKDMSHIMHISQMTEAGVSSLKIEGRLKRPEYCAAAVTACRMARDEGEVPQQLSQNLEAVFSRSGFTDGYLSGKRGAVMFGSRTKDDVTAASSSVFSSLHQLYKNEYSRVPVTMHFKAVCGEESQLTVRDDAGNEFTVYGEIPQAAVNRPTDEKSIAEKLCKTGGTPYFAADVKCEVGEGINLPISAINAMRREALEKLSESRRQKRPLKYVSDKTEIKAYTASNAEYHAVFRSVSQIPENLPDAVRRVYIPLETSEQELCRLKKRLTEHNIELAVEAPRGLFGNEKSLQELIHKAASAGVRYCMVHNIGLIDMVLSEDMMPVGGFGLNITNTRALEAYQRLGLCGAELSMELTLKRIENLGGSMLRGIMIYGRQPLMLTRNCPASLGKGCRGDRIGCTITDRKNEIFPVGCRMGCSEVFNSIPLSIVEKIDQIRTVDWYLMRFTVENSVEIEEIIKKSTSGIALAEKRITRGLFYRGVE